MEEKTLNERESLEIITRMIQETKNKLEVGDGNILTGSGRREYPFDMGICIGMYGYPCLCPAFMGSNPASQLALVLDSTHRVWGYAKTKKERNRRKVTFIQLC